MHSNITDHISFHVFREVIDHFWGIPSFTWLLCFSWFFYQIFKGLCKLTSDDFEWRGTFCFPTRFRFLFSGSCRFSSRFPLRYGSRPWWQKRFERFWGWTFEGGPHPLELDSPPYLTNWCRSEPVTNNLEVRFFLSKLHCSVNMYCHLGCSKSLKSLPSKAE